MGRQLSDELYTEIKSKVFRRDKKRIEKTSKKVYQYSLNGDFLKQWDSVANAAKTLNISPSTIAECCNKKYKKAGDFIWSYIMENFIPYKRNTCQITEEYLYKLSCAKLGKVPKNLETMRRSRWKEVIEYEGGIETKRYINSFEADRQLNLKPKTMSNYLTRNSKKIRGHEGKQWEYAKGNH